MKTDDRMIEQRHFIESNTTNEDDLRLRRFRIRWKARRIKAESTSNFHDLDNFTYVHTHDHACGNSQPQKRPFRPSKRAHKFGKNKKISVVYISKIDRANPFGHQVVSGPDMDGQNRVLLRQ